ncbi:MAG: T9SS type A sorting domain-containing protein [Bacteroidia bacterium]|nr:T9SS type A sorting domain-containing protein [Bacteroidia bacterium]
MKKSVLLLAVLFAAPFASQAQVVDIDGNVYDTVHIGNQIWTRPNLKVTRYRNGDSIPQVTDSIQWCNLTSGAYCNYNNDTSYVMAYGRLYNWYAVHDLRNLAPQGWHVPTYEDWDTLQVFLGYDLVAGGKLKEMGTAHWMSPNTGASDEYDFTARPGGQRTDAFYGCMFSELTQQGYWWSSSEMDTVYPWGVNISYNSEGMTNWAASTRKAGFSIRLISDTPQDIRELNKSDFFRVFPNPASDVVYITNAYGLKAGLHLYTLSGRLMAEQDILSGKNSIDIGWLPPGLYLIKLYGDDWTVQQKLIKTE